MRTVHRYVKLSHLVGGIPTPLKNMKVSCVSWGYYSQYMEKSICSKPPTIHALLDFGHFFLVKSSNLWLQIASQLFCASEKNLGLPKKTKIAKQN